MSEKENLLHEMTIIQSDDAWHGPSLNRILDGITQEIAAVQPPAGGHSIWELVLHIAAWEEVFTQRLRGHATPEPVEGDFPEATRGGAEAWQQTISRLNNAHQTLMEVVSNLQESAFQDTVPGKDFSVAFMLHGIARHHVYHAGQIGLLKRLLS